VPAAAGTIHLFCMADAYSHIAFYIPAALADSAPHASSRYSCLEQLVARGDTTDTEVSGDALLYTLFGGNVVGSGPRAAVSHHAQYECDEVGQWRIIASPVHLVADHATLHFPSQQAVSLSEAESRTLMASCQDHFGEEGWLLEYGDARTWYLRLSAATSITTTPLAEAVGSPLFDALPQGSDARLWRRWTNEVQMLLHTHGVNQERQRQGLPIINSLWFWGEGRLPQLAEQKFARVLGGDVYVQGLARLSGAEWAPLPEELSALDASDLRGQQLVLLDQADASTWDERWFCTLSNMLREKSINSATLHFHNGYTTQLSRALLWRFWRRKRFSLAMSEPTS